MGGGSSILSLEILCCNEIAKQVRKYRIENGGERSGEYPKWFYDLPCNLQDIIDQHCYVKTKRGYAWYTNGKLGRLPDPFTGKERHSNWIFNGNERG